MGTVTEGKALSKRKPILRGTEGSNPAPSSGESRANLTSSIRALKFAKRDGVTRRYAAWFGAESVPAGSLAND
jgi:hypothetical protein